MALTGLAFVIWGVWLRPEPLGGRADYIIVSGQSMLPTLQGGDLVAVRRQSSYEAGDVVTYRIAAGEFRGRRIIHRIVGGSATEGFVMRGDNKHDDDLWHPRPSDIEGKLWFRLPAAGRAVAFIRTPAVIAAVAAGFAFAFVFTWQPRRKEEPEPEPEPESESESECSRPPSTLRGISFGNATSYDGCSHLCVFGRFSSVHF